jgi:hypothetical protein
MKRILIASILGIAASVTTSYGQGNILWDTYTVAAAGTQIVWGNPAGPGGTVGAAVTDSSIVMGLYAGANSGAVNSLLASAHIYDAIDFATYGGGWIVGQAFQIPTTLWSGTQTVFFQERPITAGITGNSAIWSESDAIVSVSTPPGQMANGPAGFAIIGVPEPTTLTLAGLGAAALLAYRRRQ